MDFLSARGGNLAQSKNTPRQGRNCPANVKWSVKNRKSAIFYASVKPGRKVAFDQQRHLKGIEMQAGGAGRFRAEFAG